jgi:hypothetical protein
MSLIRSSASALQPTTPRTFYLDFPLPQYKVLRCASRFIVLVAGRRFGKTTLALCKMLRHAAAAPRQICYFIAPTAKQAREIAWRNLLEMTPWEIRRYLRQSTLELELVNGSIIKLHGPEFLRGVGLDFVVLDEAAYMPPNLWPEVVLPMLADRSGRALISSTPAGFNHFYDLYSAAQKKSGWAAFQFSTRDGGFVSESELEHLRSGMDPKLYAREIEARFEPQEGRVYFAFSRERNVRELTPSSAHRLLIGLDFNVDPMTAVVAQRIGDECRVHDEIVLRHSSTPEIMRELTSRYPEKGLVHPDPTGAARKTSAEAGVTDHALVEQFGWEVYRTKPKNLQVLAPIVEGPLRTKLDRNRSWHIVLLKIGFSHWKSSTPASVNNVVVEGERGRGTTMRRSSHASWRSAVPCMASVTWASWSG